MTDLIIATDEADLIEAWNAGRLPRTRIEYGKDLQHLARWRGSATVHAFIADVLGNGPMHAQKLALAFRGAALDSGLAPATVNRRLATLKSLVKFAQITGRVPWSIVVPGVKKDRAIARTIPWETFLKILDAGQDARVRACLALMGMAAMRIAEVTEAGIEHFNPATGVLSILGKGHRQREEIQLAEPVANRVREWIAERGTAPGPLFLFSETSWLRRLVGKAGEVAGVKGLRPHQLRKVAGTRASEVTGGNAYAVKAMLRHASISTSVAYVEEAQDLAGNTAKAVAES